MTVNWEAIVENDGPGIATEKPKQVELVDGWKTSGFIRLTEQHMHSFIGFQGALKGEVLVSHIRILFFLLSAIIVPPQVLGSVVFVGPSLSLDDDDGCNLEKRPPPAFLLSFFFAS